MTKAEEAVEKERKGFEDWWGEHQGAWNIPGVPLPAWIDIKAIMRESYLAGRESVQKEKGR